MPVHDRCGDFLTQLSVAHAPKGGTTVDGQTFAGGQFVAGGHGVLPAETIPHLAKASGFRADVAKHGVMGAAERLAVDAVASVVQQNLKRLPESMQAPLLGLWKLAKLGTLVAFTTYVTGEKLAKMVAEDRGATAAQAERLAHLVTAVDLAGAKAIPLTLVALGQPHLAVPGSFVPLGSAMHLCYATARDPLAVLRAAGRAVDDVIANGTLPAGKVQLSVDNRAAVERLLDGIQAHADDLEGYHALVSVALDHSETLDDAILLANAAADQWSNPDV